MESDIERVAEVYKPIYRANYNTIRTRETKGRIKTVYHFLITENYTKNVAKSLLSTLSDDFNVLNRYKINAAFGFILRNIATDELKFFYPSLNCMLYDTPQTVSNQSEFDKLLDDLEREDATAYAMANRPSTKWRVAQIVCLRLDVYKAGPSAH